MDDQSAVEIVTLIAELWPNPPMNDARRAFYSSAVAVIDNPEDAVRALHTIFLDNSSFAPAPGTIIDLCLACDPAAHAAWAALTTYAVAGGAPPPQDALAVLRADGLTVGTLPIDNSWQMEKLRRQFVDTYRRTRRADALRESAPEIAPAAPVALNPIDTTGVARRI